MVDRRSRVSRRQGSVSPWKSNPWGDIRDLRERVSIVFELRMTEGHRGQERVEWVAPFRFGGRASGGGHGDGWNCKRRDLISVAGLLPHATSPISLLVGRARPEWKKWRRERNVSLAQMGACCVIHRIVRNGSRHRLLFRPGAEDGRYPGHCSGWTRGRNRRCNLHRERRCIAAAHRLGHGATCRISVFPAMVEVVDRAVRIDWVLLAASSVAAGPDAKSGGAMLDGTALPAVYSRYYRWWLYLGWPAFTGVLFVFYLMVVKPAI